MIALAMSPRVLLVDDEPAILGALRRIVQRARPDALIVYASDVASAVWQLETTPVRLVLTDLRLGMDAQGGWTVVRAAKAASVRAVMITGSNHQPTPPEILADASFMVLTKPVDIPRLTIIVEESLQPTSASSMMRVPIAKIASGGSER